MISIDTLLGIVCTEAIEFGGLPEVPDRMDGTLESYHSAKRNARGDGDYERGEKKLSTGVRPPIRYALELVRAADGTLHWEE